MEHEICVPRNVEKKEEQEFDFGGNWAIGNRILHFPFSSSGILCVVHDGCNEAMQRVTRFQ